jgi:hypothetical protein
MYIIPLKRLLVDAIQACPFQKPDRWDVFVKNHRKLLIGFHTGFQECHHMAWTMDLVGVLLRKGLRQRLTAGHEGRKVRSNARQLALRNGNGILYEATLTKTPGSIHIAENIGLDSNDCSHAHYLLLRQYALIMASKLCTVPSTALTIATTYEESSGRVFRWPDPPPLCTTDKMKTQLCWKKSAKPKTPTQQWYKYRKAYPEVKVHDGITYVGILAKPGMPYVLLLGEHHPITCTDNSRLLSQPAVMNELLKDGDHFLLEAPPISHENLARGYGTNNRINLLRTELQPCLRAEWVKGKDLYAHGYNGNPSGTMRGSRRQELVSCKYHTDLKNVHFHWLDYGMFSELASNNIRTQVIRCRYLDLEKLKSVPEYKEDAITMIHNSLVHSLLDKEKPPCWKMQQEECDRNADSAGGTCVWDDKGLESQNAFSWSSVTKLRPKCRSMYDYVHNELHKPKCSQFQMPDPEELAKWFVNMLIYRLDVHDTPNTARSQNFYMRRFVMDFYTLLRMFREFTTPAKRCIVYAGTSHSNGLAALLRDTQGYQMLYEYVDNRTLQRMKKEPCRSVTI